MIGVAMDSTKARYVYMIAKAGTITGAAQEAFVSQPYLSRVLSEFEQELGVTLFDRTKKPLSCTEAGKCFISFYEEVNRLEDELYSNLRKISHVHGESFSLGIQPEIGKMLIPNVLPDFVKKYPKSSVSVKEMFVSQMKHNLINGDLDLALIVSCNLPADLKYSLIHTGGMYIAYSCQYDMSFSGNRDIWSIFRGRPDVRFILLPEDSEFGTLCRTMLKKHRIKCSDSIIVSNLATGVKLASTGVGVAFTETMIYNAHKADAELQFKPIPDKNVVVHTFFAHQQDRALSDSETAFISQTQEWLNKLNFASQQ